MKMKSAEDDGILTSAGKPILRLSWEEIEKENRSKNRCLILCSFQKEKGHKMAKKVYK